jgi:hypothetical protein
MSRVIPLIMKYISYLRFIIHPTVCHNNLLLLNFINILHERSTTFTASLLLLMHHLLGTLFNVFLQTDSNSLTATSEFVMSFSCTLDKEVINLFQSQVIRFWIAK